MKTGDGIEHGSETAPSEQPSSFFRKFGVAILGASVILIGIPMIPLVGPGWLVVFTGLAILAREFAWARRLRDRTQDRFRRFIDSRDRT